MRETIFRGKDRKTGEWVFGDLNQHKNGKVYIRDWKPDADGAYAAIEVDPETVGQYIGMIDWCGRKVFEGDICEGAWNTRIEIYFDADYLQFRAQTPSGLHREVDYFNTKELEIIGNVHDNPELLEVWE